MQLRQQKDQVTRWITSTSLAWTLPSMKAVLVPCVHALTEYSKLQWLWGNHGYLLASSMGHVHYVPVYQIICVSRERHLTWTSVHLSYQLTYGKGKWNHDWTPLPPAEQPNSEWVGQEHLWFLTRPLWHCNRPWSSPIVFTTTLTHIPVLNEDCLWCAEVELLPQPWGLSHPFRNTEHGGFALPLLSCPKKV